ncbi:MAG: hypothetical protein QN155_03970 [Armatimonadota bacterium]|nr:hypothetical protein [Armatimonadota bacterium]MDR7560336.1 hypothetical protein [Armatimonadota bacterium]MDR7588300.1 hypothetical protein [Armatimonadota bacterium]MDR7611923.1 hypothetical protein [Armatimonadota bacterium]
MKKLKPQEVDVLLRIMQIADAPQNLDAMQYVIFQFDFKDYEQFILECPPGSIRFNNVLRVAVFCDYLGVLVEGGAIDAETIFELYPIPWAKMEPIIQGMRRELAWPDLFDYFERLGKQYQKWWEPKAKKIKLPEPPKAEAPRPPLRPAARPTLVQTTRPQGPATPAPARPGAGIVKPAAKPAGKPASSSKARKPASGTRRS